MGGGRRDGGAATRRGKERELKVERARKHVARLYSVYDVCIWIISRGFGDRDAAQWTKNENVTTKSDQNTKSDYQKW